MDQGAPDREPLAALIEDYLTGQIDEVRLRELEARLRDDPEARREFVRYARLHTDLHFELRAREASERVLDEIDREPAPAEPLPRPRFFRRRALGLTAAAVVLAAGLVWWAVRPGAEVAWLVNAQNCTWAGGVPPTDLRPGKVIAIDRGLAEFRFQSGARVVLEGPARLELISGNSARLHRGKLAARVDGKTGFEVLSPQGKVTDLGTEFGVSVSDAGATDVHVFEGRVEVVPTGAGATAVSLTQAQTARIAGGTVTVRPEPGPEGFIRAIVPPPVVTPRQLRLAFDGFARDGTRDDAGVATGFTHRLPGTGTTLATDDPNLRINAAGGQLELTTTNTDLNTQYRIWEGEYLGVRLADLGFTGTEDFAVSATFLNIPALEIVGQFGLYAGSASDRTIRGGLINSRRTESGQYTQFLVTNQDGKDSVPHKVGLLETGSDLRMTLRRAAGKYTLTVENLTTGEESALTPRGHPAFLDPARELFVGVFGANTQSEVRRTLVIKDFRATVWTVTPAPGN